MCLANPFWAALISIRIPADVISDCAALVTILLPDAGVAQGQCVGEFPKLTNNNCVIGSVRSSRNAYVRPFGRS